MEKARKACKPHCIVLAYPGQGHINPQLQFSKRLEHKGIKVTLVTTRFISKSLLNYKEPSSSTIELETISDGFDDGGVADAESSEAYLDRFRQVGQQTLAELLEKLGSSGNPVDCIVCNAFLPWALDIAKQFGLIGALFFTQCNAVNNIYYHIQQGKLKLPLSGIEFSIPGLPVTLAANDLPSFLSAFGTYPAFFDMVVGQFSNIERADWILCNTIHELEPEVTDWMMKIWPTLRSIGPTIPSMFLDKQIEDDKDYGFSIFKLDTEACMKWLDNKPSGSVVYVSFGSLAALDVEQMEEIAFCLRDSECYFIWVIREPELAKLPKDFVNESKRGLIVTWCSQLQVLAHEAVGCFVTHCGWNSTLEAFSLGVPMIGFPQWTDQPTNAKFIMDVWKIGIRAPVDEKGIVRKQAMEHCIRDIMENDKGKEIKRNANKWKTVAREAVDEGGSSDKNIAEFVSVLVSSSLRFIS